MDIATSSSPLSRDFSASDVQYDAVERTGLPRGAYAAPHSEVPPEHRLMIALVKDAIRCIDRYRHARDLRGRQRFAREVQWVLSEDMDWLYSFARVCETLNLDPDAVRRSLGLLTLRSDDRPNRAAANDGICTPRSRSVSC